MEMEPRLRIELVQGVMAALAARDAEAMVARMTEDVVLHPSAFVTGTAEYRGHEEIRRGMADLVRQLRDDRKQLSIRMRTFFVDREAPESILSLGHVLITRAGGDEFGTEIAYLWTTRDGRVSRLEAWLDHAQGLAQLRAPTEVRAEGDR